MKAAPSYVYVYGVLREAEADQGPWPGDEATEPRGVAGGRVRLVRHAGLAALTSPVPAGEFDEAGLRERLEDLDWLEDTARGHQRVVDGFAGYACVLPLRLATVCHDEAGVRRLLDEGRDRFTAALDALAGRVEWGVKVFAEPGGHDSNSSTGDTGGNGADSDGGDSDRGTGSGGTARAVPPRGAERAYLRQRGEARRAREERTARTDACAREVHAALIPLAERHRLHKPQHPDLSGVRAENLLNAAYLVPHERSPAFTRAVHDLAQRAAGFQGGGVRVELTGPWAPYSFADPDSTAPVGSAAPAAATARDGER